MFINKLSISRSKTVGILDSTGKTKFKKIQIGGEITIEQNEDNKEAYNSLASFLDYVQEEEKKR